MAGRGAVSFKISGGKEAERALMEMPKATAKNAGRRALRAGAAPILEDFQRRAPRLTGQLVDTAGISTKLTRRQRSKHKRQMSRDHVEMFVGAGPNPQAVQQEFGNESHAAQPSLIPAFENNKRKSIDIIGRSIWVEIEKAAKRIRRKMAKQGRGK